MTLVEKNLKAFSEKAFQDVVGSLSEQKGFLGVGTRAELLENVLAWRQFYRPNSFYGHRLASNVSIVSDYTGSLDIFTTDSSGLCKNIVGGEDSKARILRAREHGFPVIAFLGGSTIQGVGCRLPEFAIPAFVERILLESHGITSVCLNHGVAGWTSAEELHFLIHETDYQPNICIFYDGWNCCWAFFHAMLLNLTFSASTSTARKTSWTRGTSLRHCENDELIAKMFDMTFLARRTISLLAHRVLGWLAGSSNRSLWSRTLNRFLETQFSLRNPDVLGHVRGMHLTDEQRDSLLQAAGAEYLQIDSLASAICMARGIKFQHFFQPVLVNTGKPLTENERTILLRESGTPHSEIFSLYPDFIRKAGHSDHLVDLSDALNDSSEELFVDGGHLNGYGNYHIALRIVRTLLARNLLGQSTNLGNKLKEMSPDGPRLSHSL